MEGPNQPPTWPPAPTVEDELSTDDQTTPAGTDTHTADPGAPVNNGGTTTTTNNDAPQTPVNAAPADPPIDRGQIILKDQSGTQVAFGVKSNTRMEKVQNTYAERAARPVASLRFHFDGERVLPDDTVASLGMETDDIIEVMTEQIGGNGKLNIASTPLNKYIAKHGYESGEEEMSFVVNAVEVGGKLINEMEFVIGRGTKVKDFMDAWAKRAGCAVDEVVFRFDSDKEGPGLPFESEDETSGDGDFIPGDEIFVSAFTDEPTNLIRPREDVSIKEANNKPGTPRDTMLITVKYVDEDDNQHEVHCKMTETMSFDKLISMYSKRWNVDASAQRLTFNGKTIFPSDTPALIGTEHGAVLDIAEDFNVCTMDLTLD